MTISFSIYDFRKFFMIGFICLFSIIGGAQEICNNGVDDDNNGLIDLNDPSCKCKVVNNRPMIPNPSFERNGCCPEETGVLDCLDDWDQVGAGKVDYIRPCVPYRTEFTYNSPLPIPDGDGFIRIEDGWQGVYEKYAHKEYAGVCLNYPMVKDSVYVIEFDLGFFNKELSPDFNVSFYGTSDCGNLPFSRGNDFRCPSKFPGFTILKSKLITNDGNKWKKVSIEIIPERTINAIVIGPDCTNSSDMYTLVYFMDNFIVNNAPHLDFQLSEIDSPCSPDFKFSVENNSSYTYQWYKEGIALIGETASALSIMYGEGKYQLRILNDGECRVSESYTYTIPAYRESVYERICEGDEFMFGNTMVDQSGIYIDTLTTDENCDSIVTLDLKVVEYIVDSFYMEIQSGASFEFNGNSFTDSGEYPISLTTKDGCDSLLILNLSVTNIFIPNIFSPNGDGVNDIFQVYGGEKEGVTNFTLSIYNRWGELVFKGEEWDGRGGGNEFDTNVYVYQVELITSTGKKFLYHGDITVIR